MTVPVICVTEKTQAGWMVEVSCHKMLSHVVPGKKFGLELTALE